MEKKDETHHPLIFTCAIVSMFAASCSSSVEVVRVTKVAPYLKEEGAYYYLPMTDLLFRTQVKQTTTNVGDLFVNFDKYVRECKKDINASLTPEDTKKENKFELGFWQMSAVALQDPDHFYRVDVSAEPLSSFTHTVELTENGILTAADSTVKDMTLEVTLAVADIAGSIAKTIFFAGQQPTCPDILEVEEYRSQLAAVDQERKQFLLEGAGVARTDKALENALGVFEADKTRIKNRFAKKPNFKALLKRTSSVSEETLYLLEGRVRPPEFQQIVGGTLDWKLKRVPKPKKGGKEVEVDGILDLANDDVLQEMLKDMNFTVDVLMPDHLGNALDCPDGNQLSKCTDPGGNGYRYRVPVNAEVVLKSKGKKQARGNVIVAQYGPIARLPSEIGGSEGNIVLNIYPATGSAKKISVGATPIKTETVTGIGSAITGTLEARKEAREQEKTAEETAEVDALTKERDLLQLQKEIRDLKAELGVE